MGTLHPEGVLLTAHSRYATVAGVPVCIYAGIASRILAGDDKGSVRPCSGADFSWCARQEDPWDAVCSEVSKALGNNLRWDRVTAWGTDEGTVGVEIAGSTEAGEWALSFNVNLEDGSVAYFPPFDVEWAEAE